MQILLLIATAQEAVAAFFPWIRACMGLCDLAKALATLAGALVAIAALMLGFAGAEEATVPFEMIDAANQSPITGTTFASLVTMRLIDTAHR